MSIIFPGRLSENPYVIGPYNRHKAQGAWLRERITSP
jgi:hypothetical protein